MTSATPDSVLSPRNSSLRSASATCTTSAAQAAAPTARCPTRSAVRLVLSPARASSTCAMPTSTCASIKPIDQTAARRSAVSPRERKVCADKPSTSSAARAASTRCAIATAASDWNALPAGWPGTTHTGSARQYHRAPWLVTSAPATSVIYTTPSTPNASARQRRRATWARAPSRAAGAGPRRSSTYANSATASAASASALSSAAPSAGAAPNATATP